MSKVKDRAAQLKEISKKFGYELKHTHALEIISHLDNNTNRHVALKNEKKIVSGLSFNKQPFGINHPFLQAYVIELKTPHRESIDFLVTNEPYLGLEDVFDFSESISSLRFLTEEEVNTSMLSLLDEDDAATGPNKPLLEWITDRAKETKSTTFLVFNDSGSNNS